VQANFFESTVQHNILVSISTRERQQQHAWSRGSKATWPRRGWAGQAAQHAAGRPDLTPESRWSAAPHAAARRAKGDRGRAKTPFAAALGVARGPGCRIVRMHFHSSIAISVQRLEMSIFGFFTSEPDI